VLKVLSLDFLALALVILGVTGMIVPTAAVPSGEAETDQVWDEPAIELKPADGPNGDYASIDSNGNLSVDLSNVPSNALTSVEKVFTIRNTENTTRRVWITHDGGDAITFSLGNGKSLENSDDPVKLKPDNLHTVSLVIDTRDIGANESLMTTMTLHAERVTNESTSPTETPTPTATESPQPQSETTPTAATPANETATPTPSPQNETTPTTSTPEDGAKGVEVEFDVSTEAPEDTDPADEQITIREMNVSELDEDPNRGPTAVINQSGEEPVETDREARSDLELETKGYDVVTEVNKPINLTGSRSLIGQSEGVDRERQIAKVVDIQVPEERKKQPGTVRITITRSKLGDTDPQNATIAHQTQKGWQLLDTKIVESTDQTVTLEARTPGFSPFAVFVDHDVTYTWTLPDGSTFEGKQVRSQFDEPGVYNVTLTVTDSLGRSDRTDYRILVNDPPTVEIEGPDNVSAGENITLHANVTNAVGDHNVTWVFSDGTTAEGENVTRSFEQGETVVEVTVEDEFGATGRDEATVVIGEGVGGEGPSLGIIQFNMGLESRIAVVGLLALILIALLRWLAASRYRLIG
jgi:hypothetical protein